MEKNKEFKSNFLWNIIGTTASAFNSLFFMIAITRINGLEDAGIFTIAFSTACILYMIGIYAGRIYQVTENNDKISDTDYIVNRLISSGAVIIIVILFVIFKGYNLYKSTIFVALSTYKALEAISEVFYGILQKNDLLNIVGKSSFIKAITSLIAFVIVDLITKNVLLSSISISIIYILVIFLYDIKKTKNVIDCKKFNCKRAISIFKSGFFTFAISFLGLYMTNAPKYAIDKFLTEDIQAIFGIIIMPATVMGLVAQFLIHPYLNQIFELYKNGNLIKLKKLLYRIIASILIIGIICSIAGYTLGTQVLGIIYGLNLGIYKIQLFIILIGATFYTLAGIISPVLITMRCTKIQFVVYVIMALIELILCNVLVMKIGFNGAIWAYFITMFLYCITFFIVAMKVINSKKLLLEGGN